MTSEIIVPLNKRVQLENGEILEVTENPDEIFDNDGNLKYRCSFFGGDNRLIGFRLAILDDIPELVMEASNTSIILEI